VPKGPLPAAVREFLKAPNLATVVTLDPDGAPQATVVWFLFEDDRVLVNTKAGRVKVHNLANDPRVALTVFDCAQPYLSVQLRGVVEEERRGEQAAADIHRLSQRYTSLDYSAPEERISYLIGIRSWSAWGLAGAD